MTTQQRLSEQALALKKILAEKTAPNGQAPALDVALDRLVGAREIADSMGLSERQVRHLLRKNALPVGRLGGLYLASRRVLAAHYERLTATNS